VAMARADNMILLLFRRGLLVNGYWLMVIGYWLFEIANFFTHTNHNKNTKA
jgi:hypothetical protein